MGAVSLAICKAAKEAGVHIETDTEVCFSRALSFFVGSCKISQILNYNFCVLLSFST